MPFKAELGKDFWFEDNRIVLSEEWRQKMLARHPKITGGKICSLLGLDPWKSDMKTWCEMVGIYKEISDDFVVNAGIVIEDKIFNYMNQMVGDKWNAYDAKDRGYDEFSGNFEGFDKNEIFGGLLDGVPKDDKTTPILEIKTFSINRWQWVDDQTRGDGKFVVKNPDGSPVVKIPNGGYSKFYPNGVENGMEIPQAYQLQLGLYCYLKHNSKGIFAVAGLQDKDYLHPEKFVPTSDNIKIKPFEQDLVQYEQQVINPLTNWYNEFILTGRSPELKPQDIWFIIKQFGYVEYNKMLKDGRITVKREYKKKSGR